MSGAYVDGGAPLIKSMLFQLRLNCSARSHRLRWSPGDSTDLHNATQLAYIVYDLEKRDFRQFFRRLVTLLGRCDRVEEISVASKARSSAHGFKSSANCKLLQRSSEFLGDLQGQHVRFRKVRVLSRLSRS